MDRPRHDSSLEGGFAAGSGLRSAKRRVYRRGVRSLYIAEPLLDVDVPFILLCKKHADARGKVIDRLARKARLVHQFSVMGESIGAVPNGTCTCACVVVCA